MDKREADWRANLAAALDRLVMGGGIFFFFFFLPARGGGGDGGGAGEDQCN